MALKCESVLSTHGKALVSVSGGADSDVMVDVVERVRTQSRCEVDYVWYDTGMEYRATRDHLSYLEDRYGIEIMRVRATKTIPVCVRDYGQPFVSKMVSQHLGTLQRHGFMWDDGDMDSLIARYPDMPMSTLKWWTNAYQTKSGVPSSYCIGRNKWLKEYVMDNPPTFRISADCCKWAKKRTKHVTLSNGDWDVEMVGVRRAEGGVRSTHGRCFVTEGAHKGVDAYYPLFWLTNQDRAWYERTFNVRHSACYEKWGFTRTGCVGCPFNRKALEDLDIAGRFEPNMARAARRIFADSYEYTLGYRDYRRRMDDRGQLPLF